MGAEDGALFRRMARGAPAEAREALAALHRRYAPDVERFLRRLLGDDPMTEDLTQETFLAAARHAAVFRGGDARAWLLTLAARRGADELRARRRRVRREERAARHEVAEAELGAATDLEGALDRLPTRERAVLELHYVDGLTHAQAADVLGISLRTAKGWASAGLERLRGMLDPEGGAA